LKGDEQAVYESGIHELDQEEHIEGDLKRLRELRARVAQLEAENKQLRNPENE
jgi:cell division protein FtsB